MQQNVTISVLAYKIKVSIGFPCLYYFSIFSLLEKFAKPKHFHFLYVAVLFLMMIKKVSLFKIKGDVAPLIWFCFFFFWFLTMYNKYNYSGLFNSPVSITWSIAEESLAASTKQNHLL